jgi:hypothetical protein
MKRLWLILAACLGLAVQAFPASAAVVYHLNQKGNWAALPAAGNFGTVTLSQTNGTTVHVSVSLDSADGYFFAVCGCSSPFPTGTPYAIAFSIAGDPSLTSLTVTGANSGDFTPQNFSSGQAYAASPFTSSPCGAAGTCFDYAIAYTGGLFTNDTSLVFDVTRSSGLLLSNFVADIKGNFFAADVAHGFFSTYAQNYAASVPEPSTWLLFIAGLVGLTALAVSQRRRKLARVA